MKSLTIALVMLLIGSLAPKVLAQDVGYWTNVAPPDESFAVMMPQSPEGKKQKVSYGPLELEGAVYSVSDRGATYTLWSLKNSNYPKIQPTDTEDYLDTCAELVWISLFKSRREKFDRREAQMMYERTVRAGGVQGRQYFLRFGQKPGVVRFFADEDQIYVLAVYNASPNEAAAAHFLNSFQPDRNTVAAQGANDPDDKDGQLRLMGGGPGRGGNAQSGNDTPGPVDYNRIFSTRELTERARILSRPEPQYTESARQFQVSGTVVLRAVLAKSGEVTDINVIRGLPHGLTRMAKVALQRIRFSTATKDGVPVSQWIVVEYNFNIY